MRREFHVRFCEGPGVQSPRATRLVVMARFIDQRIVGFIEEKIERRLGLVINRDKTRVVRMHDEGATLDFLGYTFRFSRSHRIGGGPRYWRLEASNKAQMRARDKLRDITSVRFCWMPIKDVVDRTNALLRGWLAYFSKGHPAKARRSLVRFAEKRLIGHLRRRSQRPYRPPEGVSFYQHVHDLGLIAPAAARG